MTKQSNCQCGMTWAEAGMMPTVERRAEPTSEAAMMNLDM
jgi:hypothetical protein